MQWSRFAFPALAAAGLVAVACSDQPSELTTDGVYFSVSSPCADGDIDCIIDALFPPNQRNTFRKRYNDVIRQANSPSADPNAAESQATNTVDDALRNWYRGRLTDNASLLSQFIDAVFLAANLPAPHIPPDAFGPDGGLGVVGKNGGIVVTGNGWAGVDIPPGALTMDQLVVISQLPNPTVGGQGPLNTDAPQYPLYFDISILSSGILHSEITVGMCVVDPPDPFAPPPFVAGRLALAHPSGSGIETYPVAPAPFLDCTGAMTARSQPGPLGWLASLASRVFGPRALEADPGGLGGKATSLSPIAPVDPTPVASVDVQPAVSEIIYWSGGCAPAGQAQLSAMALDGAAGSIPNRQFSWTSSDPSVASVDQDGLVTAAGSPGSSPAQVMITASTATLDGSASVAGTARVFVVGRSCGS